MDQDNNLQSPDTSEQDRELAQEILRLQHGNKAERAVAIALTLRTDRRRPS